MSAKPPAKPPAEKKFTLRTVRNFNTKGNVIEKQVWKTNGMPNAKEGDRNVSTSYTPEKCTIGNDTCVRGNKEDLLIRGKWTFLPEQGRIKHFVTGRNEGLPQYRGKIFRNNEIGKNYSHNHYFSGEGDKGFENMFNLFAEKNLLEDPSGNLINGRWDFTETECDTTGPIYTSPTMQYKLRTVGETRCIAPNQGTEAAKGGKRRRTKTRKTKTRKTKTRRR